MIKFKFSAILILILIILICFVGCSSDKSAVFEQKSEEISQDVNAQNSDKNIYLSTNSVKQMQTVSRSNMSKLYFDETNYSISVFDANAKTIWHSLPSKFAGSAYMLSVELLVCGNKITLNSQDDCLSLGNASYEIKDNILLINYDFKKTLSNKTKIDFTVPLEFTAKDGMVTINIDCKDLYLNQNIEDVVITRINLMEFFGANTNENSGDYILIPDGSGAIIDTSKKAKEFKEVSTRVYGADIGNNENQNVANALIASFGMKVKNAAFVALIEKGEEVSTIHANKALTKSSYNRVGASFSITPTVKTDDGKILVSENPFNETIQMSYRFLANENATYSGMASATRELLIRNKVLSSSLIEDTSSLPLNLDLIASAVVLDEKGNNKIQTLTNFEQAYEILNFLKSKNFNNINLTYSSVLEGSNDQYDISKSKIMPKLGSSDGLQKILDLSTKQQGINVYLGANLITSSQSNSFSKNSFNLNNQLTNIQADKLYYQKENLTNLLFSTNDIIEKSTNSLIKMIRETDFIGVNLKDAGKLLYTDNNKNNFTSRSIMKDNIATQISAISSSKNLIVDTGNIYSVKYATSISNLPDTAKAAKLDYCQAVPFIQIVLHGYTDYSSSPANLESDLIKAILKDIEYASLPSFQWYYENLEDNYYYMNDIAQIQVYYDLANKALNDLRGARITNHYKVKENVYCTKFDTGSSIYVNYNDKIVSLGGVDIQALSFVRIN